MPTPLDFTIDSVIVGGETELGIGIEPFEGCAVKAQKKFAYRSGGLKRTIAKLGNRVLHDSPTMITQYSAGMVTYEGSFDVTWTPEGACPMLLGGCLPSTTVGTSGPSGTTVAPYTSSYKNLYGDYSFTLIHRMGNIIKVYPGCRVDSITWNGITGEVTDIVTVTFQVCALDCIIYDMGATPSYYTLVGMSTASTDVLPPYTGIFSLGTFAGTVGKLRRLAISLNRNLGKRKEMDGRRGFSQHFAVKTAVSLSADVYFQDATNILRDFGYAINTLTPVGAGYNTNAYGLSVTITPPANPSGYSNTLGFNANNVLLEADEMVRDEREVDQMLTFTAVDVAGDSSGTDVFITVINSLTAATLATAGTPIPNLPATAVTRYINFAVNASPAPTTTSFTADNGNIPAFSTLLNDPYYLTRNIYFETGVNTGLYEPITAYTPPTGGLGGAFVFSAFPNAPATGDIATIR